MLIRTFNITVLYTITVLLISNSYGYAQTCGEKYTINSGDTLSAIASRTYKDGALWTLIYNSNQSVIGNKPSRIFPGQLIRIPCLDGSKTESVSADDADPVKPAQAVKPNWDDSVLLVTAGDYAPFTDQKLEKGGMVTDLLATAFEKRTQEHGATPVSISWVNDWSAHLPMVKSKRFDGVFPWYRPDCDAPKLFGDAKFRCENFKFSEPVFQVLMLLFVKKGSDFQFNTDDEIIGKNICRMEGYLVFDFDQNGRNWHKEKKINLTRPKTVKECFDLLDKGEVDAVSINEFTGKTGIRDLNLGGKVVPLRRPMSVVGLHVLTAKSHPQADQLIEHVNKSVEALRDSGEYDAIVEKHMTAYWQLN